MIKFQSKVKIGTLNNKINIKDIAAERLDTMRGRLKLTDINGEEILIDLPRGEIINDGDIFGPTPEGNYYRIKIKPEQVLRVSIKTTNVEKDIDNFLKLGYNLGNHHLEVLIEGKNVYVTTGIGIDNVRDILSRFHLPMEIEKMDKIISTTAIGYYAGEDKDE